MTINRVLLCRVPCIRYGTVLDIQWGTTIKHPADKGNVQQICYSERDSDCCSQGHKENCHTRVFWNAKRNNCSQKFNE